MATIQKRKRASKVDDEEEEQEQGEEYEEEEAENGAPESSQYAQDGDDDGEGAEEEEEEEEFEEEEEDDDEEEEEEEPPTTRRATGSYAKFFNRLSQEQLVLAEVLKNRGLADSEIVQWLKAFENDPEGQRDLNDYVGQYLKHIKKTSDALKEIPEDVRQYAAPVIAHDMQRFAPPNPYLQGRSYEDDEDSRWFKKMTRQVAMITSITKGDNPELAKKLDLAMDELRDLRDEKKQKELEAYTTSIIERLNGLGATFDERIKTIEQRVTNSTSTSTTDNNKSATERLADEMQANLEAENRLRRLLGKPEKTSIFDDGRPPQDVEADEDRLINKLKAKGFKIEAPKSIEDVSKLVDAKIQELETKYKSDKDLAVKQAVEQERKRTGQNEMWITFATEALGVFADMIPKGKDGGGGSGEALKRTATGLSAAVKSARQQQQEPAAQSTGTIQSQ
nr:hypothetical protein [uncultured Nitrososphaera sp.]